MNEQDRAEDAARVVEHPLCVARALAGISRVELVDQELDLSRDDTQTTNVDRFIENYKSLQEGMSCYRRV